MITKHMQLNSKRDAHQWASDYGLETEAEINRLADWIWANKPAIGCTFAEHPLSAISDEDFWKLF